MIKTHLFGNIRGDFFGGLTTSVVAVTLAIAFGAAAFAPLGPEYVAQGAVAGLCAAIVAGFLASIFGGTPAQITGPTAPMSVVVTSAIVHLVQDSELAAIGASPAEVILLFVAVTIICGGFLQMLLGLVGGGRLIKFIPYPVVAGFMNGIALIILIKQLHPLLGVDKSTSFASILTGQSVLRYETIIAGIVTIAATVISTRLIKALPGTLIGLVFGIATYYTLANFTSADLLRAENNPFIIGPIPRAIPTPKQLFSFARLVSDIPLSYWTVIIVPSLTLSILAAIDSLLTSVVADVVTRTKHDSNKELVGQGIGNIASGLFGGLPAAGSTSVTILNASNGGRTPLSGVITSVMVLLIMLLFSPLVRWIPMAVLAGVLIVTSFKIVDYQSFNLLKNKSTLENLVIVLAVTIITVSIDLMIAVGSGLIIACVLFVKEHIGKTIIRRKYRGSFVHSKKVRNPAYMHILEEKGHLITVYELSGSLFFGTCDRLLNEIEQDLTSRCIILDLKLVNTIDLTGAQLLLQLAERVMDKGNHLVLSYLDIPGDRDKERVRTFMEDLGVTDMIGPEHIFLDTDHAMEWAEDLLIQETATNEKLIQKRYTENDLTIFKDLTNEQLQSIRKYLRSMTFKKGDIIFRQNDPGDGIYLILSGCVSVLAGLQMPEREHRLATFGEGVFFGDMAILENQPRSATVLAAEDTDVLFMSKTDFEKLMETEPLITSRILRAISHELANRLRMTDVEVRTLAE